MALVPLALKARLSGRPYWALRYFGGRVVEEPECDWLDAPHRGRQALRLYCPSGESVTFAMPDGADGTGRFFQFKSAVIMIGAPSGTLAHVVGMVVGTDGGCVAAAWDCRTRQLSRFTDNAYDFRYGNTGRLCAAHLGLDTK